MRCRISLGRITTFAVGLALFYMGTSAVTSGQLPQATGEPLPDGVYADSRNRLPVVSRDSLDTFGKSIYDGIVERGRAGTALAGFQGPGGINLYSPRVARSDSEKIQYWRSESKIGRRLYELAVLVTARELDHQFIWTAHEPAATSAGLSPEIIDIVKFRKPTSGLDPRDAMVIQVAREVFRHRSVDLATFASARKIFDERDLVDIVSVMAQYASGAVLLNVFDQQLPQGRRPLLPIP